MKILIDVFFFLLGGAIGSFLNVCIYRMPRGKSVVRPASGCPHCGTPIKPYDNIPFVSYLVLRGRCRKCGESISVRYLLVEVLTGALFVLLFETFGFAVDLPVALLFVSLLLVVSFIDLEFKIIPDVLSVGGLFAGMILSFFRPDFTYKDAFFGVLVGGGILYAIAKSYELLRKREGMGGGDIKLLAMVGAFCGVKGVIFSLVTGSVVGTAVGIPLILIKGEDAKYAIPFGPFLSFGALLYLLVGPSLVQAFFEYLVPTG